MRASKGRWRAATCWMYENFFFMRIEYQIYTYIIFMNECMNAIVAIVVRKILDRCSFSAFSLATPQAAQIQFNQMHFNAGR